MARAPPGATLGVAAVDEDQAQPGAPQPGHVGRAAHDHDHVLLEAGGGQGGAQAGQRVQATGGRVDQVGVVVLPAGLVFLRAAVVVDGDDHLPGGAGRGGEVDGGLAAVAADLQDRPATTVCGGGVGQGQAFGPGHEPGRGLGGAQ
jgi:hypothetical protein